MREILFRGKRKDTKKMVYGCFFEGTGITGKKEPCIWLECGQIVEVIPETVGQFIGLTDKNGKKIFEGDIIGYKWNSGIRYDWYKYYGKYKVEGIVRYGNFNCSCCDGVFGWYIEDGDIRGFGDHTDLEVIGNIHDNPELLGE